MYKLRDIAAIEPGYSFRSRIVPDLSGTVWVIQLKDVRADLTLDLASLVCTRTDDDPSRYLVHSGDVLFAARGSRHPAVEVREVPPGTLATSVFYRLKINSAAVCPGYVAWWLNQSLAQDYCAANQSGSGIPFISREILGEMPIEVPPLEAQQKLLYLHDLMLAEKILTERLAVARQQLFQSVARRLTRTP
jgi:hypothetical protein